MHNNANLIKLLKSLYSMVALRSKNTTSFFFLALAKKKNHTENQHCIKKNHKS